MWDTLTISYVEGHIFKIFWKKTFTVLHDTFSKYENTLCYMQLSPFDPHDLEDTHKVWLQ